MVGDGGEADVEYESDPEEAKISLKLRRREASDDEDDVAGSPRRAASVAVSDAESDGQGAAAEYDDGEEDEGEEEYYDEEYEEEIGEGEGEGEGVGGGEVEVRVEKVMEKGLNEGGEVMEDNRGEGEGEEGEGKKENEPFAVPTSGAFYMHDDRFCDNTAGARNRRTFGGRRLWETKDERKWGHDKFEEMNIQDRHYEGMRSSRGYYRGGGRGRGRGTDRGKGKGTDRGRTRPNGGGSNNQNLAAKDFRGRGPRRYQLSVKTGSETLPTQNKRSTKSIDKTSNTSSGRNSASIANSGVKFEANPARKVASNLNYASPPFYPSGSSSKDVSYTQEELRASNHDRNRHPSAVDRSTCMPPSNSLLGGHNAVDSINLGNLLIGDSLSHASSKPLNNMHVASPSSSSSSALLKFGAQGRGLPLSGPTVLHTPEANNLVRKVSPPTAQASPQNPVQNQNQDFLQASVQQLVQHSIGASQGPSLKAGRGTGQGTGIGSLMYAGPQGIGSGGNVGSGRGDQNLTNFLPVMQFGAQNTGGLGVPAVGMAFPGYVAQPNGLGNSEMTWLPVLASAASAMGATYCPPYLSVDGTYQPHLAGKTSALPAPSKDNNVAKSNNGVKSLQKSEVSNDDLSQRQNKPRRYSEMKFSQ